MEITKFICNLTSSSKCLEILPFQFRWPAISQNSLFSWYSASNFFSVNFVITLLCPLAGNQIHCLMAVVKKLQNSTGRCWGFFDMYHKYSIYLFAGFSEIEKGR